MGFLGVLGIGHVGEEVVTDGGKEGSKFGFCGFASDENLERIRGEVDKANKAGKFDYPYVLTDW